MIIWVVKIFFVQFFCVFLIPRSYLKWFLSLSSRVSSLPCVAHRLLWELYAMLCLISGAHRPFWKPIHGSLRGPLRWMKNASAWHLGLCHIVASLLVTIWTEMLCCGGKNSEFCHWCKVLNACGICSGSWSCPQCLHLSDGCMRRLALPSLMVSWQIPARWCW